MSVGFVILFPITSLSNVFVAPVLAAVFAPLTTTLYRRRG